MEGCIYLTCFVVAKVQFFVCSFVLSWLHRCDENLACCSEMLDRPPGDAVVSSFVYVVVSLMHLELALKWTRRSSGCSSVSPVAHQLSASMAL